MKRAAASALHAAALALLLGACASDPPRPIEPVTVQGLTFSLGKVDGFGNSVEAELQVVRTAGATAERIDLACVVLVLDGVRSEWTDHAGYSNAGQPIAFEPGATTLKVPVAFTFRQPLGVGGAGKSERRELKVDCLRARTGFG